MKKIISASNFTEQEIIDQLEAMNKGETIVVVDDDNSFLQEEKDRGQIIEELKTREAEMYDHENRPSDRNVRRSMKKKPRIKNKKL